MNRWWCLLGGYDGENGHEEQWTGTKWTCRCPGRQCCRELEVGGCYVWRRQQRCVHGVRCRSCLHHWRRVCHRHWSHHQDQGNNQRCRSHHQNNHQQQSTGERLHLGMSWCLEVWRMRKGRRRHHHLLCRWGKTHPRRSQGWSWRRFRRLREEETRSRFRFRLGRCIRRKRARPCR